MRYFFCLVLFCIGFNTKADYINDGRHQTYGKITYIDQKVVKLASNCNGEEITFKWSDIFGVSFNSQCQHPGHNFTSSPLTAETKCRKKTVFVMQFKNLKGVSYADTVSIEGNKLRVHFVNNRGLVYLDRSRLPENIKWINRDDICQDDLKTTFPIPHL